MTNVLRIAHLKISHHVCNPEVGKREIHPISTPGAPLRLDKLHPERKCVLQIS